ncbi:hypothetical protein GQ42DRAFT_169451 [Ramicandelaber brevisporus]|nr:hypothetical protein GQ42DRAFT_169451 [Ramicandelaber brevisporus]
MVAARGSLQRNNEWRTAQSELYQNHSWRELGRNDDTCNGKSVDWKFEEDNYPQNSVIDCINDIVSRALICRYPNGTDGCIVKASVSKPTPKLNGPKNSVHNRATYFLKCSIVPSSHSSHSDFKTEDASVHVLTLHSDRVFLTTLIDMKVLFIATALFAALAVACKKKADYCVRNLWCSNKKCAAQKSLGSECKADEECDGYPRPIEQNSDFLALCQNGRCKTTLGQCSSANDCGNGVPCKSFKDDGSRKRCARGNAVGDRCKVSADCLDNLACYGGRCAEAKYKKIGDKCKDSPECRYGCGHNKKCSGPPKGGCLTDDESIKPCHL